MGFDLIGDGGHCRWSIFSWPKVLRLAQLYGWQPLGTIGPKFLDENGEEAVEFSGEWEGGYETNGYQIVTKGDALNLAKALERALPDIPEEQILPPGAKTISLPPPFGTQVLIPLGTDNRNLLEFFSGHQARLKSFIDFCRAGEFCIG